MEANPNAHPRLPRLLAGLLAFLLAAPPTLCLAGDSSPSSFTSDENNYPKLVIGPGDMLFIQVYGENGTPLDTAATMGGNNQLPTNYEVDSDGVIEFPFLGRVKLGGLTPVEASEKIAGLLSKPRKVTVLIQVSNTYWVSVLGNVSKPGKYQIMGRPTILSALADAGGPLPGSDLGGTILLHDSVKKKIDLNQYFSGEGNIDTGPYLYPGDTLMIQKSPWPDLGAIAIVASILASGAIITVELSELHH